MKKFKKIIVIIVTLLSIYAFMHITPRLSIRTHLLVTGHPILTFTTKITKSDIYDEYYGTQYSFNGFKGITGNIISEVKVKKVFFLYFASYGEA